MDPCSTPQTCNPAQHLHGGTVHKTCLMPQNYKRRFTFCTIYYCIYNLFLFQELGLPYTDVSVDKYDDSVRQSVKDRTGRQTVPQIFFNAVHIGGNDDLQNLVS